MVHLFRWFPAALLLLLLLPLYVGAAVNDDPEALLQRGCYFDIHPGAWYADAAAWAKVSGTLAGTSKSTFSPAEPITRAQFLNALYVLSGSPAPVAGSDFPDVTANHRAYTALLWAQETGLTTGTSPVTLAPDDPLTRQQAALFLYRLSNLPGVPAGTSTPAFPDLDDAAPWARDAIAWAAETGLLTGLPDGRLHPADPLTRAQAAVLLYRFHVLP